MRRRKEISSILCKFLYNLAICSASLMASVKLCPRETTLDTNPIEMASCALTALPVTIELILYCFKQNELKKLSILICPKDLILINNIQIRSNARPSPIKRGNRTVPPSISGTPHRLYMEIFFKLNSSFEQGSK